MENNFNNFDNGSLVRYIIGASRIKFEILDSLYGRTAPFSSNSSPFSFSSASTDTSPIPTFTPLPTASPLAPMSTTRTDADTKHAAQKQRNIDYAAKFRHAVMYIDAHSIFFRLYKYRNLASIYADSSEDLVRELVIGFYNVIGHYRRYMAMRMHLDNTIYVFFNTKSPKYNSMLYPEFSSKLIDRYSQKDPDFGFVNTALAQAWEFILELSPFFEGIYCIDNGGIDNVAAMGHFGFVPDTFYTIFSRSMYATQLLGWSREDNVVQLFNRRDDSYLITPKTCYKRGILNGTKTKAVPGLSPDMLPFVWMLAGCRDVSMPATMYGKRTTGIVSVLNAMYTEGDLIPGMSINSFLDALPKYLKKPPKSNAPVSLSLKIDRSYLIQRYRVLDARLSTAAVTPNQAAKLTAQIYDVYNESELEQLNEILAMGVSPELLEIANLNMNMGLPEYY